MCFRLWFKSNLGELGKIKINVSTLNVSHLWLFPIGANILNATHRKAVIDS